MPYYTSCATFLRPTGSRTPDSRCFVEEKCRTVPVVPLFLSARRGKVAQLEQYGTFPLHSVLAFCINLVIRDAGAVHASVDTHTFKSRIRPKGSFGLTPGKLLTLSKLTPIPHLCVPQRRNYAKIQICETTSVDSTEIDSPRRKRRLPCSLRGYIYIYVCMYIYIYICIYIYTYIQIGRASCRERV